MDKSTIRGGYDYAGPGMVSDYKDGAACLYVLTDRGKI